MEDRKIAADIIRLVVDTMRNLQQVEGEDTSNRDILGNLLAWEATRPTTSVNTQVYLSLDSMAAMLCVLLPKLSIKDVIAFLRSSSSCKKDFKNWKVFRDMAIEHFAEELGEERLNRVFVGLLPKND